LDVGVGAEAGRLLSQRARAGISRAGLENLATRRMSMPASETDQAKHIACAEIVPDCPFAASAATEEELLKKVVTHAAHDHGITEVTPELAAKVKAAIRSR
jgi:predicted small metal-binding protein